MRTPDVAVRVGVGVRRAVGRVGSGLTGVVIAALLASGVPASADPTATPSPRAATTAGGPGAAGQGADAAASADQDAHDSAALVAATQALQAAQAQLASAQATLAAARTELAAAQQADADAQSDLDAAAFAEQRATRDLAVVKARILSHQNDLGRLARTAYQTSGTLGEWAVVLESVTPDQLAARLATLHSVASAGNAVIARLEQDRADLTNSQAQLAAALEATRVARAAAATALADKVAKESAAAAAEQQLGVVVVARQAALTAARKAALEDKRRYQAMTVESGALALRITELAAKLAKGKNPPQGTGKMDRPGRGVVTSPYGPRFHPILHYVKIHTGIDFAAADGISYAADDGVVLITEFNVAYGNMTVIDHGTVGGLHMTTLYAHQAAFGVQPGDRVTKGQPIGVIGETGYATGPHLHFEVRIDGRPVDPAPFLVKAPLPPVVKAGATGPTTR